MAGIYIHIPFCRKACHYCNFHFSVGHGAQEKMVDSILRELELRRDFLGLHTISTIYFGGGTPSLLSIPQLTSVLAEIYSKYSVEEDIEITLEANPDDLNRNYLSDLKKIGINRLSIGIQSFNDADLSWMNRSHTAQEAMDSVQVAYDLGFNNISIDLIYGIPGSDANRWAKNLSIATSLPIQHISAYALTVEPKTALSVFIQRGTLSAPEDAHTVAQFYSLCSRLSDAGFAQYEISNFAKQGYVSRHNSAYWNGVPYLGIGPSAHSHLPGLRRWNVSNNSLYIQGLDAGIPVCDEEILTQIEQANERIMTSLRQRQGLQLDLFSAEIGEELFALFLQNAQSDIVTANTETIDGTMRLTSAGIMLADAVISTLFLDA